jgi:hypothetical protein
MSDADKKMNDAAAEPADAGARMRERLLAYHCGALEEDEAALIRGRLESDPDWQRASADAQKMLGGLKSDGSDNVSVPTGLGERAMRRMNFSEPSEDKSASEKPRHDRSAKPTEAPRAPFFTPRMAAAIFLICALPAVWMSIRYATNSSAGESIRWQPDNIIAAGGPFAPNLLVRDSSTHAPSRGVRLAAYLTPASGQGSPIPVGEGETNEAGVIGGESWKVPGIPAGDYRITVEARSRLGVVLDRAEHTVKITRSARLALSPDRTQARPGETIRVRALLVSDALEKPLPDQAVTLDLIDPRGNRIARSETKTTKFGLAWAEFPLDSAAPEGAYTLSADAAGLFAKRDVEVKQYTLPPFRVSVTPDRPWFALRDRITGKITAQTFDGHALAGAKGSLQLLDLGGNVLRRADIQSNAEGIADFDLDEIGGNRSDVSQMRISVTLNDAAGRSSSGRATIGVGVSPVVIDAVPEAGELVPGVENRVYIVVRAADGTPVQTRLNVSRGARNTSAIETDENGVAVYLLADPQAPAEVLSVTPDYKNSPPQNISMPLRPREKGALLVRTDRAVLKSGQTLNISITAGSDISGPSNVLLALRQDGRTVATGGAILQNRKAALALKIPAGVAGALSVEASLPGEGWSDSRMILVSGSDHVRVVASADKASYRPGDRARLNFSVSDASGAGIPAAVSVVGVDDALLAITGEHPGLAQALQASGVSVFKRPDVPLDPQDFSPERGADDGALAALASVRANNAEMASVAESPIDTSHGKIAALDFARREQIALLGQWVHSLIGIALVLGIVLSVSGSTKRTIRNAVPVITIVLTIVGLIGGAWLAPHTLVLTIVLSFTLLIAHTILLYQGEGSVEHESNLAQTLNCIIGDPLLIVFGILAVTSHHSELLGSFIFASAICAILQWNSGRPREVRIKFVELGVIGSVILVLCGLILASLTSARRMTRSLADVKSVTAMKFDDSTPISAIPTPVVVPGEFGTLAASVTPHLRWDFPETMIFAPEIITDENGHASFEFAVADSLTSWRVQADAIAVGGGTGWTDTRLVVTQPFSVDLTLPSDVTAGDVLHVPAVVSNHSENERVVDLTLNPSGAKVLDGQTRQIRIGAKAVASVDYAVRFDEPGLAVLTCNAISDGAAREKDSVQRALSVVPDGEPVAFGASALIGTQGELAINVPANALPGTVHTSLRLHRGPLTQMIEGLESMLQEPHGCFEQTSSSTYPNIMILRYLKANSVNKPDVEKLAKDYILRGYQRLLGFEVGSKSGSFSLYGQAPASTFLTAYGLLEFSDMGKVVPVDPALLERTRAWLKSQMNTDGSFRMDTYRIHESAPQGVAATAYVVLALGKSAPGASVDFLRRNIITIEKDAYLCAITANALLPHDRATAAQLAGKLRALSQSSGGQPKQAVLPAATTLAWGYGEAAAVEASAMGVTALIESGSDLEFAQQLLAGIQARAGNRFGFGSTHATVLALKALERASGAGRKVGAARAVVLVNGRPLPAIDLPAEETASPISLVLDLPPGNSRVQIQCEGGPLAVRVVGQANVPWSASKAPAENLRASVRYDAKNLQQGQPVLGTLELSAQNNAEVPMVEWGIPAGFSAESEDLNALKNTGALSRWEMSGRSLRLYLPDLAAGKSATLAVRFYAGARGELKARAGRVYEYYRNESAVSLEQATFSVK